jgi:hypothetical protein
VSETRSCQYTRGNAHAYRLYNNLIGYEGTRAIAEAIAANEDTALVDIRGVDLSECVASLGLPEEFKRLLNDDILAHMQARRLAARVKSARGGVRKAAQLLG